MHRAHHVSGCNDRKVYIFPQSRKYRSKDGYGENGPRCSYKTHPRPDVYVTEPRGIINVLYS